MGKAIGRGRTSLLRRTKVDEGQRSVLVSPGRQARLPEPLDAEWFSIVKGLLG